MSDDAAVESAPEGPEGEWVLMPDVPDGVRLSLSTVLESTQIDAELFTALGRAFAQLDDSAKAAPRRVTCPKLRKCGAYVGGCPRLTDCDTYSLKLV